MYELTRQDAAEKLWMSTRTIDRYVKSWKIRAKKQWKIIYLNSDDLNNLNSSSAKVQEVIVERPTYFAKTPLEKVKKEIVAYNNASALDQVYNDLRSEIKEKDKLITELSIRVWQAEEIAKNSVSLIDYKKSQLLLEESKTNLNQVIIDLESDKEELNKQLKYQKTNNIIMLIALVVLFVIAWTLFLLKI